MRRSHALWVAGLLVVSCGSAQFPYDYYGVDVPSYEEGELFDARNPDRKIRFKTCDPETPPAGEKCVVLLADEFETLVLDYLDIRERLKACEDNQGT